MNKRVVDVLCDLAQLDIDAVNAYDQALAQIDDDEIHQSISSFRNDHVRHIEDLNNLIRKYDGAPLEMSKDFKGFIIEGFTMLRSLTGTHGALKAMESNEKTTNNNYADALNADIDYPIDVLEILQKNYADEQRHLNYIQMTLKNWDATVNS